MKKLLVVVAVLAVLVAIGVYFVGSNLGGIVKRAIEAAGPAITQTPVTVDSVRLSPRSGGGGLHGFVIGNPPGYSAPFAIKLGDASIEAEASSLFSDKVHLRSFAVSDPQVTLEGGISDNNLKKILANIDSFSGDGKGSSSTNATPGKKYQIDDFVLKGTKVDVRLTSLGGLGQALALVKGPGQGAASPSPSQPITMSLTLPDIHLTNLGSGGDGLTAGELSKKVVGAIINEVIPAVTAEAAKLANMGKDLGKDAVNNAKGALEKVGGGVGDLLKRK